MAEDDIYGSEGKYRRFVERLDSLAKPPAKSDKRRKYYCKNKANLKYFRKLIARFEAKDISYVRRIRLFMSFLIVVHKSERDLKELEREDIDMVVAFMHTAYKSPKSKSDFIRDTRYIWKIILPEKDSKGRLDETLVPYPVRHLSSRIDKSKEKMRKDKLTPDEFSRLVTYFSNDARMQAYLTIAMESLARPQEILYRRIKDVELFDNYAKILISDHGKEGTGIMQCIDSYPYLLKWLEQHPMRNDENAFLFINTTLNIGKQLTPYNINKKLGVACKNLGLNKRITCYSLKRNGVTFRRLAGQSDMEIQHAARWTSTKQLKTGVTPLFGTIS